MSPLRPAQFGRADHVDFHPLAMSMSIISATTLLAAILCLLPETVLGQSTPDVRESVDRLIQNCRSAGQLSEAEKLLQREIALDKQTHGAASRDVAEDLDTLSDVLSEEKKYSEADGAINDALAIYTALDGPERATNPFYLGRLASLATHEQRFAEAEHLYQDILALETSETGFEPLSTLRDLAEVYRLAKDYVNSEAFYLRIIQSNASKPEDGQVLGAIEQLGAVYEEQRKLKEAEALYLNAVQDAQRTLPRGDLALIANLDDLASFYARQERLQEADEYYRLALEQFNGFPADGELMDHNLAIVMRHYASVLRKEGRTDEADQYEKHSKTIEDHIRSALPVCHSES